MTADEADRSARDLIDHFESDAYEVSWVRAIVREAAGDTEGAKDWFRVCEAIERLRERRLV